MRIPIPARGPGGERLGTIHDVQRSAASAETWGELHTRRRGRRLVPMRDAEYADGDVHLPLTNADVAVAERIPDAGPPLSPRRLRRRRRRRWGALAGLAAAQVAYGLAPSRPAVATRAVVGAMTLTALLEGAEARGGRRGIAPALAGGAIGFGAELLGVATGRPFGDYRYTAKLGPRVGGVPLLAGAAWTMMARPAWITAGWIARRPAPRVAVAAGALTAWDVLLDPRMVREGYWTWARGGRYEGIPVSNFAGWFATSLAVFALYAALDRNVPEPEDDGALALYAWIWTGESFANAALWNQPRTAAAGAAAMGAFAAPALARRARPR